MGQRELWDAEAATFDDEPDHGLRDPAVRAAWRSLLRDALPSAPARVADLGCGTGTLSLLLAEEGYAVDGLDLSPGLTAAGLWSLSAPHNACAATITPRWQQRGQPQ